MKVSLKKTELLNIISKYLRVKVDAFEIELPGTEIVAALQKAIEGLDYTGSQKIAAIKAFRTVAAPFLANKGDVVGLADAKWAIENWEKLLKFVGDNARLPESGYGYSGDLR